MGLLAGMGVFDIVVLIVISVAVLGVAAGVIYRKVTKKGGCCDCGCSSCPSCSACRAAQKDADGKK